MHMSDYGWVTTSPLPEGVKCRVKARQFSDAAAPADVFVDAEDVGVIPVLLVWRQYVDAGTLRNTVELYAGIDGHGEMLPQGDYQLIAEPHSRSMSSPYRAAEITKGTENVFQV